MNWIVLHKYLKGACSEEELRKLGEWLQENPANEDFFSSFIESYKDEGFPHIETDAREAWKEFKKREKNLKHFSKEVSSSKAPIDSKKIKQPKGRGYKFWYYSAAAAIILAISILFVAEHSGTVDEVEVEQVSMQEITTAKGQRTNLRLSDGSQVMLNSESKLLIPEDYAKPDRKLYLEGEAFFEVEHDEDHPFLVITPQGYAKDLGTQFNVTAYDSNRIEVALKEGLASIGEVNGNSPEKDLAELSPNKLGTLTQDGGLTITNIENMSEYTGWTEGKLVFNETPFPKVVKKLERWYNIEIELETPQLLMDRTLTATYNQMPLNEVLDVLSVSIRASYERENKTVVFGDDSYSDE